MKPFYKRLIVGAITALILIIPGAIFDHSLSIKTLKYSATAIHWYSLIPPILAVTAAVITRRFLLSLFAGVISGAFILNNMNIAATAKATAVTYLWGNFASEFNYLILLFVFSLIAMVSIINKGGGTQGVVNLFGKTVKGARSACLAAIGMGLAIFFDDYTNTIVVGSTMRTLTDKMKVSREKLAYIVDSTTAPVAGLALISTWIGFEVEQLQHISESLGIHTGGYALFLQMLPYRYYCIFTIFFVVFIAFTRRDFGPMLKAERRTWYQNLVSNPDAGTVTRKEFSESHVKEGAPARAINAIVPVFAVIASCLIGIVVLGSDSPSMTGITFNIFSFSNWYNSFIGIGQVSNGVPLTLCAASILGVVIAGVMMFAQKILTFSEIMKALFHGWRIIYIVAILLVLAWAIRQVCAELGTAYFILAIVDNLISPVWLPLAIFIIASLTSFATGTSWGTMGILFPVLAPVAANMGNETFLVISLAAILDGSIFGDHCSPISDTTILSAISTNCDLIDHVKTQLPYALTTAAIAGFAGYIPASFGVPPVVTYCLGIALALLCIFTIGRRVVTIPVIPTNVLS